MTDFYTASGNPGTGSPGASVGMRAEFSAIAAAFALLAGYTGNSNRIPYVNSSGTGQATNSGFTFDGTTLSVPAATASGVVTGSRFVSTVATGTAPMTVASTTQVANLNAATAGTASAVAVGGITGLGTGVATALAVNVGTAGAPVVNGGALGTPASGVATNLTGTASGLSIGGNAATATTATTASAVAVGGITGLGTGVATALAVNVGTAGAPVVNGGALGTPASGVATNLTGTASGLSIGGNAATATNVAVGGVTGLGTGVATALATNVGTAGAPVVNGGALGTPSSGVATNLTGTAAGLSIGGNAATVTTNANLTGAIVTSVGNATTVNHAPITNSIGADVALNNVANYFDGPSVAQGTSGTWFVSGTVTVEDAAGATRFYAKLWDGTTVIASAYLTVSTINYPTPIALSGYISAPAGNLRISVRDITSTTGLIRFNATGNSKDSTITAIRIA